MIRKKQVIVGGECHELASRLTQGNVAVGIAEEWRLRKIEQADPLVVNAAYDPGCVIGAAVGDDQQFEVWFSLLENGLDGEADDIRAVVRRHQHRHPWSHPHQPCAEPNENGISGVPIGRRYLSGLAWSYRIVGKLTTTASVVPML